MKVFITRKIPAIAEELLSKNKLEVTVFQKDRQITKSELIKHAKDADGIITLLSDKIDKEIIDNLPKCKVIANYAVGYNNIDVGYAKSKNIVVTNTPDILTNATADLALSLILTCARNVLPGEEMVREGRFKGWGAQTLLGIELNGKTAGIIGAGRIGQAAAKRLKAFGCDLIYYNRTVKKGFEKETGAKKVSLNALLKKSDIISIHIPYTKETFHLLNSGNMGLIKQTAIIVNTARGEITDENVLIKMLKQKKIFSAGLDVYENEPDIKKEFLKLKNVVLLPHLGSATFDARNGMAELAARNVINVLRGKKAITQV